MFLKMNERRGACVTHKSGPQMLGAAVGTLGRPKDSVLYRHQDVELGPESAASAPRAPSEDQDGGGGGGVRTRTGGGAGTRARA